MPFVHALTVQIFKVYLFAVGFVTRASIRSVISWWSTSILYTSYTYSHTYAYKKNSRNNLVRVCGGNVCECECVLYVMGTLKMPAFMHLAIEKKIKEENVYVYSKLSETTTWRYIYIDF